MAEDADEKKLREELKKATDKIKVGNEGLRNIRARTEKKAKGKDKRGGKR